jgi:hypothetical protein
LTFNQKAHRVLQFLLGLRSPAAFVALQRHGFTESDLRDGWERLQALSKVASPLVVVDDDGAQRSLAALSAFESTWLPIARAALQRHHPRVVSWLFKKLPPSHGTSVIVRVHLFCDQLQRLQHNTPFGNENLAVVTVLRNRGLTEERLAEGRALVEQAQVRVSPSARRHDPSEQHAVETALWSWYLEWSAIARAAVKDRRVLRALGFLQTQRDAEPDGDQDSAVASS